MALASYTGQMKISFSIHAQKSITGFQNIPFDNQVERSLDFSSATANNLAGGGDSVYAAIVTLGNSANTTLNLASIADPYGTTFGFARVKGFSAELLSVAQDATNGTNCTGVTIGGGSANHALLQSDGGFLNGTAHRLYIDNGGAFGWIAGGNNGATVTNSDSQSLFIENQDSGNSTALRITIQGGDD